MRIVVAMDKFKGTLSSAESVGIVSRGFCDVLGDGIEVVPFGLADGGEGTCEALTRARGGSFREVSVHDPLGRPLVARYGVSGTSAFMEMASASGLGLLRDDERNPLKTSTFGFGEMLLDAVKHGAREIVAGIGGSATNDGGTGMAEALGCRFFDREGNALHGMCGGKLSLIGRIDMSGMQSLSGVRLMIASDVQNPLLGVQGAAAVYGPQKGATAEMVVQLEAGLRQLLRVVEPERDGSVGCAGDGAAGGLGFGCRVFCKASFASGARLVMKESGLTDLVEGGGVSLVVTGEGCTDGQTEAGKLCCEVAKLAHDNGVKCVLLSGGIGCSRGDLLKQYDGVFVSGIGRCNLEDTLRHAHDDLYAAARSVAGLLSTDR